MRTDIAVRAAAGARLEEAVHHGQRHDGDDRNHDGGDHEALNNPAKPMKASDRLPATRKTMPMPLARAGTLDSSMRSRIDAISTSASVRPTPAPNAKATP